MRPEIPVSAERFDAASDVDLDGFGPPEGDDSAAAAASAGEAALTDFPEIDSPPTAPEDLDAGGVEDGNAAMEYGAADTEPGSIAADPPAGHRRRRRGAAHWDASNRAAGAGRCRRLQSGILALIILDAIVIGWRADFVRFMPQTASFYAAIGMPVNLRGLDFDGISDDHRAA